MTKPKTLVFALLITAAATVPLKAAEQCCPPCPNGVLVGVTADSCGSCVSLTSFIPGCTTANATACTACDTGFYLSGGKCTPCNITLPGCTACSNANTCTACATDYTLSGGKCTSTAAATVSGLHCNGPNFITGIRQAQSGGQGEGYTYGNSPVFIPNCLECDTPNGIAASCKTCAPGTTRTWQALKSYICK